MNKGNKKAHKRSYKNKEAIKFVLSNRELDDPNRNNPNATSKILLQVNKDSELTEKQKEILSKIPKECLGVYDEEAKLKKLLASEAMKKMPDNEIKEESIANQITDKKVKFDLEKSEIISFDKKAKIEQNKPEIQQNDTKDEVINASSSKKEKEIISYQDLPGNIDDDKFIDELFKRAKVNAKIVEYNEYGLEKDIDPALLEFVTNKEFTEGVDIFIPPLKINELEFNKFHTDIKPEDMNEDYKEVDAQLQIDSETNKGNGEDEQIDISSKANKAKENDNKDNELEDDFILLANEGELPVEFIDEKPHEEKIQIQDQSDNKKSKTPSYKFITKEELEFVNKKFEKESRKKEPVVNINKHKMQKSTKEEFDEAIEEMLQYKKDKDKQKHKQKPNQKVLGLTQKYEDEGEYEEYESIDEEDNVNKQQTKDKKGIDHEDEEYEDQDDEYEEYEDEWEEEDNDDADAEEGNNSKSKTKLPQESKISELNREGKPKTININGKEITIEYMDKTKEADPFLKEDKMKKKKKEKKYTKGENNEDKDIIEETKDEQDEFTLNDLEKIVTDKEIVEKTIQLFNHNEQNQNEQDQKVIDAELDSKFIHEPKRRIDITSVEAKIVNLPKAVNDINTKAKKDKVKLQNEDEDNKEILNANCNNATKPVDIQNETKEEKALRKKLLKLERKEKRVQKKKAKNAFKEEKKTQSHQIAEGNKVFHYGLSVKDL